MALQMIQNQCICTAHQKRGSDVPPQCGICHGRTQSILLTGSQVPRSESELAMHKNSYFVAAFKTGTPWTFNSKIIKKLVGEEFWSLIELDYNFILDEVKTNTTTSK